MNFFKRAALRLGHSPGRSLLLTALLFAIGALVLSGFVIEAAAARATESAQRAVGATATMRLDLDAYMQAGMGTAQNGQNAGMIGGDGDLYTGWVDRIGESEAVAEYNYELGTAAAPVEGAEVYNAVEPPPGGDDYLAGLLTATGVRDSRIVGEFRDGRSQLVEGEPIVPGGPEDLALIEERFAEANGLGVGDRFVLETGTIGIEKTRVELTVGGIYRSEAVSETARYTPPMNEPGNNLFLAVESVSRLEGVVPGEDGSKIQSATFTLSDPDDLDALQAAAEAAGVDTALFPIEVNDKQYQRLVGPIASTAGFASVAVWTVSAAGAVILTLLVVSWVRERRREMGVLLSMGERRGRLVGQLLAEVGMCAVLGLGLASAVGQPIAQWAADALLAGEVASAQAAAEEVPDYGAVNDGPVREEEGPIDELDVSIGGAQIARVGLIGLGLTAAATAVPAIALMRLKPREILSKGA